MKTDFRNKLFVFLAVAALLILPGCSNIFPGSITGPRVVLETGKGKNTVVVEIADTPELRKRGLMFRPSLAEGQGMFFVFDGEQKQGFWMKNTLIPLDMVFIDANYKVVSITKNAQPCKTEPCPIYSSQGQAQYVLEINGGAADNYGVAAGDNVNFSKN